MKRSGKIVGCLFAMASGGTAQVPEWFEVAINASVAPIHHAMAYAGNGRVMAFGGVTYDFSSWPGGITNVYQTSTWLWNGTTWQTTASTIAPAPRTMHALSYDATRDCVVLFGGVDQNGLRRNDTWEWTAAGWTLRSLVGPVPRESHAMAYDSGRQRTVLFGGFSGTDLLADTWEWNGVAWTPRLSANVPPPRISHGLAYDAVRSRTVMVGGQGTTLGGVWEWDGDDWTDAGSPLGNGREVQAVYDSLHGSVMVYSVGGPQSQLNTNTWNGTTWTASPAALVLGGSRMAFDVQRQRSVIYGGFVVGPPPPFNASFRTYEYGYAPRPASVTPFGTGCGMPPLALAADANTSPRIGTTLRTDVVNVPFGFPFVAIGSNEQFLGPFPLPLVLDGFGYLGCLLHHDAVVSVPCTQWSGPSTATFDLSIPNVPALLTARIYLQAWSLAPAANPGGLVLSNALRVVIGNS